MPPSMPTPNDQARLGGTILQHSNFQSRTAQDVAGELSRRNSMPLEQQEYFTLAESSGHQDSSKPPNPYEPATSNSTPPPHEHHLTRRLLHLDNQDGYGTMAQHRSLSGRRRAHHGIVGEDSLSAQIHSAAEHKNTHGDLSTPKPGLGPRPVGGNEKLGMFSGVYVPTCLNVLSILMFLRFGFILGQSGVLGIMGMLIASYAINLITTFSLSAIASNGTVRGGGAYYLISRSLGPEFGGSIGVVFYLGFVFNTGMNAVGLIDCIKLNFGAVSGNWANILPESQWYSYLWSTIVLALCTTICLAGSSIFARASNGLLIVLLIATLSIPFSTLLVSPFESRKLGIEYTGLSWTTFVGNLKPRFTKGAAGSQLSGKETFQDLFGILFPATGGIFAGASMSGDLKNPSKSIPKGTLYGLATTFVLYALVIFAMAATITRASFTRNANVIQDVNISGLVILAGEFASSAFSTLMGVIGSAKLLQALARDNLLPGFWMFGQGTEKGDEPTYAIIITYVVAQITMLCDLNQIASFVTMTYLMTFLVMNLACFLLKIGSAPNFRPSFHFFNWQTAFIGTVVSAVAMFFVDGVYATGCVGMLIVIFLIIHYTSPPKSWGDVSQSLIYHQVRKYLLRLKQEHVKFWRPQILLFVNDPRRQYKLIQFCNSMKKGSLYILGHVIVTEDFGGSVPEARRQQAAWTKYIDFSKIKAFVNIAISPGVEWGARNIVLSAGLGGMRPNIAVLGFYNLDDLRRNQHFNLSETTSISRKTESTEITKGHSISRENSKDKRIEELPTDSCKTEGMMSVTSYVTILEDFLLRLQINVAIAKGFQNLEIPRADGNNTKKYIDLWPIQMSAEIAGEGDNKQNVLTTNFDTYTLILQLGVILNTVPTWKKAYKVRVAVFVEYESDVEEERGRVKSLLENLRIEAEILVFWLASGELSTYEIIVNGAHPSKEAEEEVEECLKNQDWWEGIQKIRGNRGAAPAANGISDIASIFAGNTNWPEASFQQGPRGERIERFIGLRKLLRKSKRRHTISGLTKLGVNLGMQTHHLSENVVNSGTALGSASEDSGSDFDLSDSDSGSNPESAASEGDIDDFESDSDSQFQNTTRLIRRRRSHGDTMRGPPPSKRSTGEKEIRIPERTLIKRDPSRSSSGDSATIMTSDDIRTPKTTETPGQKAAIISSLPSSPKAASVSSAGYDLKLSSLGHLSLTEPDKLPIPEAASNARPSSVGSERPTLSRHASKPKFSSRPVPMTRVATEEGTGPSIMFTDTPSPPPRRSRLPSAYQPTPSQIPDAPSPALSRHGSTYSTQALPLSFNDLPCRSQHLILNELMRKQSKETAVMFTTLPSPVEGTSQSEEACVGYLGDLEVLCKGCPPCLMVHSNSMTVTMSL